MCARLERCKAAVRALINCARTFTCALVCLWLGACSDWAQRAAPAVAPEAGVPIYVVKRGWHVDIGVARRDLQPPLQPLAAAFTDSNYVLFGFGDRRYLVHGANMLAAVWPGAGIMLVTTVRSDLAEAFEQRNVAQLWVNAQQMAALQNFIRESLGAQQQPPRPLTPGPYPGSAYFEVAQRYSGAYTCNTWAAQALERAQLPVSSSGVVFAWQLWHQVERLTPQLQKPTPGLTRSGALNWRVD